MPHRARSPWKAYFRSTSTHLALTMGFLMYASYAAGFDAWDNPALVAVTAFIGLALPSYSRWSNRIEQKANHAFALVTVGRLARFAPQFLFNLAAFLIIQWGGVFGSGDLGGVGGILGAAALTTAASQGAQYIAIALFNRNIGDINRNVLLALSLNIVVTALALMGLEGVREVFIAGGIALALFVFGGGLLSDLRGRFYPRRGIAVFFGTFNPFHKTHLALVRRALAERGVERVIIHPTLVPKGHRRALDRGELVVDRIENGMQVYEKTDRADPYIDYFPTGRRFFAPETRAHLMRLAIEEEGLTDTVEVAFWPEIYDRHGFHGVLREVRRRYPGRPVHGLHGSDTGGMMVRAILDECGWIYPMAVLRRDNVSATAIRAGAQGMTPASITAALAQLQSGTTNITVNERKFRNEQGVLLPA